MTAEVVAIVASYAESLLKFRGHLIKSAAISGNQVYALAPDIDSSAHQELVALGATPVNIRLSRTGLNPLTDIFTFVQLLGLLRRIRPTVVLTYTIKPVVYGSVAASFAGVSRIYALITGLGSAVTTAPGSGRSLLTRVLHRMYRKALSRCDAVMFQNPDDLSYFVENGLCEAEKGFVVNGSGVDTDYFGLTPLPAAPVFLLIARLIKDKGIREYAEAARAVAVAVPEARFLLVGWHDSNPSAISPQEIEDWQGNGVIEFLGRCDDVRPAISQCSVYVLPSYREGTPRTVLEAMAMGRPIITTDVPGCRETVNNGVNGILVSAADVDALAGAMQRLARDPRLRAEMGKKGREVAETKYDVHKVNRAIFKIMQLDA